MSRIVISAAWLLLGAACATPRATPPAPPARTLMVPEARANDQTESAPTEPATSARSSSQILPSGLGVEELKLGAGAPAAAGQRVRLHYVGTLEDGTVFDSSRERGMPFEVELGQGFLIKGFEEGVIGMREGGVRRLIIPPELGYGERGSGKIPPSAILIFELELLAVLKAP